MSSLSCNSPQGSKDGVAYPSSPGEETSGEGITHQPAQPITYLSIEFNQTDTCFYYLRRGYEVYVNYNQNCKNCENT